MVAQAAAASSGPSWVPYVTAALAGTDVASRWFGGGGQEGLSREDQRFLADFQWKQALRNEEFQKEQFAYQKQLNENGISMRVADANRAGIHPLVALGGSAPGVGGGSFGASFPAGPASEGSSRTGRMLSGIASMGQNISRSMLAQKSAEEKAMFEVQLRNEKLQGDLISQQIAESQYRMANPPGNPPGLNPYAGGPSGDAVGWPYKHVLVRQPDGTLVPEWSWPYAQSMQGRPFKSAGTDILDIVGDAWRASKLAVGNLWRGREQRPREYIRGEH